MKKVLPKYPRVLAIAPSTGGFGFALLEGLNTLANWGAKKAKGDKNAESLAKIKRLITHYKPDVIVLEDTSIKPFRRSPRIRTLTKRISRLGKSSKLTVALFSRERVRQAFFEDDGGTKYAVAEIIAKKFHDQLSHRLPPKRRPWMSEDSRMDIFDAVALAVMLRKCRVRASR